MQRRKRAKGTLKTRVFDTFVISSAVERSLDSFGCRDQTMHKQTIRDSATSLGMMKVSLNT